MLLIDEMFPPAIAKQLRERHEVDGVSVQEVAGLRGHPDDEVFEFAQLGGRAIVTENVIDYRPLFNARLAEGRHHGVVFTTNATFPRAKRRTTGALVRVLAALAKSRDNLTNQEHWL